MTTVTESPQDAIAVSDERDLGAFIPSVLDDFGLDPYQFRVYCRLARRAGAGGQCWESINNIADKCRMNRKTVMGAITFLLKYCLVRQTKRPGKSDVYQLTHHRHWINPKVFPQGSSTSSPKELDSTSPSDGHLDEPVLDTDTTSPPEGHPINEPVREVDNTSPSEGHHQSATRTTPVLLADTKVFPQGSSISSPKELMEDNIDQVATTQPLLVAAAVATSKEDPEKYIEEEEGYIDPVHYAAMEEVCEISGQCGYEPNDIQRGYMIDHVALDQLPMIKNALRKPVSPDDISGAEQFDRALKAAIRASKEAISS